MASAMPIRPEETHGIVTRPGCDFLFSSRELGWASMTASVQAEYPFRADVDPSRHHLLVFHRQDGARVCTNFSGKFSRHQVPARGLYFWPADRGFSIELESRVETMHLYLNRDIWDDCVNEWGNGPVQCEAEASVLDPQLWEMAVEVSRLMQARVDDVGLYIDALTVAMAKRLIFRQLRHSTAGRPDIGGSTFSPVKLRKIAEYVDANLCEQISLAHLSQLVGMSTSSFIRKFSATLGQTPYQFVLERRIEFAQRMLVKSDKSLADIALDCGFSHQEHMTNVFRSRLDTTPTAYRRSAAHESASAS